MPSTHPPIHRATRNACIRQYSAFVFQSELYARNRPFMATMCLYYCLLRPAMPFNAKIAAHLLRQGAALESWYVMYVM